MNPEAVLYTNREILSNLAKNDLELASWPGEKDNRCNLIAPKDSLTMISYMSVMHSEAVLYTDSEILSNLTKNDLELASWPW